MLIAGQAAFDRDNPGVYTRLQRAATLVSLRAEAGSSPATRSAEPAPTAGGCVESVAPGPATYSGR